MDSERTAAAAGTWVLRALLAIALIAVLHAGKPVFVPFVVALVLAFALSPAVRALQRSGLPAMAASGVVVVSLLLAVALGLTALSEPASRWWRDAPQTVARLIDRIDTWRAGIPLIAPPAPAPRVRGREPPPPPADPLHEKLAIEGAEATWTLVGSTSSFVLGAAAALMLLFFLLASERWMLDRAQLLFERRRTRHLVLAGLRHAQRDIARYLVAQAVINTGVGLAVAAALAWLGVPNPALWGTVAGVLNFIPYLGPLVTTALLVMVGAQSFEAPADMLAPAFAALAVHGIESNLITPVFVGRRLSMHPLALLIAVMLGTALWGLAGAMLAVPVLIAVRCVCRRRRSLRALCVLLADEHDHVPLIRRGAAHVARKAQAVRRGASSGGAPAATTRK